MKLPLNGGKAVAVIDSEDFQSTHTVTLKSGLVVAGSVSNFGWSLREHCYPNRTIQYAAAQPYVKGKQVLVFLHRFLTDAAPSDRVQLKDRDGLNCRRDNLSVSNRSTSANRPKLKGCRSQFKGVTFDYRDRPRATIWPGGRPVFLGTFKDEVSAAKAYDDAAREHYGDFAVLNFPKE